MTQMLKKQGQSQESKKLIESLRKDLAMLVIETEGLIAVVAERANSGMGRAAKRNRRKEEVESGAPSKVVT
jgi:hypothetical protein